MQEAKLLVSALACALASCRSEWPVFLPVHDALRDAYWGIATSGIATLHFETDSVHISSLPRHLLEARLCHCSLLSMALL